MNGPLSFACFSTNNWEKRKARKQQFMLHLSLRADVGNVVYVEPHVNFFRLLLLPVAELKTRESRTRWVRALTGTVQPLSEKLYLYTPVFFIPFSYRVSFIYNVNLFLTAALFRLRTKQLLPRDTVLWLYHPLDHPLLRFYKNRALAVFDWAEAWTEYFTELTPARREAVRAAEDTMIRTCDIVFTVSRRLLAMARPLNACSYQLKDGTIPALFEQPGTTVPDGLKTVPRPILGYIGSISHRVDLGLLAHLSEQLPDCSIVLIGNNLRTPRELARLRDRKNVFFLNAREYADLPAYVAAMDVCLLPYIPALVTSPATKIYDYLAAGKPVVSNDLVEMDAFDGMVKIARTPDEFLASVKAYLDGDDPDMKAKRTAEARQNSWALRVEEIMNIVRRPDGPGVPAQP